MWSNILITEFMASNQQGLEDFEGDTSDWIELYNGGADAVDLEGWFLTNDKSLQNTWAFPVSTVIGPQSYILIFASGKSLVAAGGELHTDFKLSSKGEYLALVQPDGVTIEHEYKDAYPIQVSDYSYGLETNLGSILELLPENAALRYWIPVNGNSDSVWMQTSFNDSSWSTGTQAFGFEVSGTNYRPFIHADAPAMYNQATSAYVRIPFTVSNPGAISTLTLSARYDDGFVAFLNGHPVVRANAPIDLTYKSAATAANDDAYAVGYEDFDITKNRSLLVDGQNILALQALNLNASSSDLLLQVELTAAVAGTITNQESYFAQPSPGRENSLGLGIIGPLINDVTVPDEPIFQDDVLNITVTISPSLSAVAPETAMLHYFPMFEAEVSIRLFDDGGHNDGAVNDGIYGAAIPEGVAAPGEMSRWRILREISREVPEFTRLILSVTMGDQSITEQSSLILTWRLFCLFFTGL
ncbi:MAG: lamin tail domain-containing protein [Verrucomicrobiota bacterium]|nr:lamin tail domain-containing protein [Verrucomicrobiota bacterium]